MSTRYTTKTKAASYGGAAALFALLFIACALFALKTPVAYAASYEIPEDAQASGTRSECTWFIRSAADPDAPGELVIYPTNGESGVISWPSIPPWYTKASLIQSAYIAPGVKAAPEMYGFLYRAKNMTHADVSNLDMSECESIWSFFNGCNMLTEIKGVSDWDVSKVTSFENTFKDCTQMKSLDLSSWEVGLNTSGEMTMECMFDGCTLLESVGDTSSWDVSSCITFERMFYNCSSMESVAGTENWDVSSSESFTHTFGNSGFRRLDLSSWDTRAALDMHSMLMGISGANVEYIRIGPLFTFEPEGLEAGVWTPESRATFPVPLGSNSAGATFTGRWVADESGLVYASDSIPSLTAGTYRPEAAKLGSLELSGNAVAGSALTATLHDSINVSPSYQWYRATRTNGAWSAIEGAQDASYTLGVKDIGRYVKCVVSDASGALKDSLEVVSDQIQAAPLSGTVRIVGSYEYSDALLSIEEEGIPQNATLSYAWYTGSAKGELGTLVATDNSYQPEAEDVGKFITCVVTDSSGLYTGELRFEGECVTATLALRVPDTAYGLVSANGDVAWEDFGEALNEGSCPILISKASSTVPGLEEAECGLEGQTLQKGTSAVISWTGASAVDAGVYQTLQQSIGSFVEVGSFVYQIEPAALPSTPL